jgi:hypothetical protein
MCAAPTLTNYTPSATAEEWFFERALAWSGDSDSDSDDDDGGDDDDGDIDCPTGPTYLPPPAEACQDIPTTDDFCTMSEFGDCCATNAVATAMSVRHLRLLRPLRVLTPGRTGRGQCCDAMGANAGKLYVVVPVDGHGGEHVGRDWRGCGHAVPSLRPRHLPGPDEQEQLHQRRC